MIHMCSGPTPHTRQPFLIFPNLQIHCLASYRLQRGYLGNLKARCEFRNHTTWPFWEFAARFCSTDPDIACVTETCLEAMSTSLSWCF